VVRLRDAADPRSNVSSNAPLFWVKEVSVEAAQQHLFGALEKQTAAHEEKRWLAAAEQLQFETGTQAGAFRATVLHFALLQSNNKKFLRIAPNCTVDYEDGGGPWGFYYATPTPQGTVLRAVCHTAVPAYLALNPTPAAPPPPPAPAAAGTPAPPPPPPPCPFRSTSGSAVMFLPSPATVYEWGLVTQDGRTPANLMGGAVVQLYHLPTGILIPIPFRAEVATPEQLAQQFKAHCPGAPHGGNEWCVATGIDPSRTLADQRCGFFRFIIGGGNPILARLGAAQPKPTGRLSVKHPTGEVNVDESQGGAWATFRVDLAPGSSPPVYSVQCVGFMWKGERAFITHSTRFPNGLGCFQPTSDTQDANAHLRRLVQDDRSGLPKWLFEVLPENSEQVQRCIVGDVNSTLFYDTAAADAVLPVDKVADFVRDGFVVLDRAIARRVVDEARHHINNLLGKGPPSWEEDQEARRNGNVNYNLTHSNHHTLVATVYQSYVSSAIQRLLGGRGSAQAVGGAQLAIRFPVNESVPVLKNDAVPGGSMNRNDPAYDQPAPINVCHVGQHGWHIDGMGREKHLPFGLLVLIALSDQDEDGHGNFTVWPGAHNDPAVRTWYHSGNGSRPSDVAAVTEAHRQRFQAFADRKPQLAGTGPKQVHMKKGDVALVHPLMPHAVGINTSPDPRYTIIMRFQSVKQAEHEEGTRLDPLYDIFAHLRTAR
jgi:hypothetical protein